MNLARTILPASSRDLLHQLFADSYILLNIGKTLCRKWQTILNDYAAPYFHFREFASKKLYSEQGNAYYGWSDKKRDSFLYDLALLASESAVPIGAAFNAKRNHESGSQNNPFENAIIILFDDLKIKLDRHWPNF